MKFLVHEHKSVKAAIAAAGLTYTDFTFVKRRGRLYITYQKNGPVFSMYRKSETVLDANNQWVKLLEYTVYEPAEASFTSWEGVEKTFAEWLASLA